MKHRVIGMLLGCAATIVAAYSVYLGGTSHVPAPIQTVVRIVSSPLLMPGSAIAYFGITGDDYVAPDFWRYVVPISVCINAFAGALLWPWVCRVAACMSHRMK
jgi:hypothetical protein